MDGLLTTLAVLAVYFAIVVVLQKKKILEKYNMGLWGPVLMVRTHKGENLIESASKLKRLWAAVGPISIIICAILGALLMPLLVWNAILSFQLPVEATPSPALVIGLPGINPIMSGANFWYAILGLVVAIIFHEGMHGVMTRFAGVKLKSVGLMFLAIPLGAFVEPDDEGVNKLSRFKRSRLFAAGPFANLAIAVVFGLLFSAAFMGTVQMKADGAGILSVGEDSPAEKVGLQPGMIITSMDGTAITNRTEYINFLSSKLPGDNISITVYGGKTCFAVLGKATDYGYNQSYANKSYLGVATIGVRDAKEIYDGLSRPFSSTGNFLSYILLPLF
ncbi:MAG: site-2 protease family protein, partial [Candidatus Thermoplasmatota archaeon]|nr:site-2 protease family protein [Candidatus Thermoplasmatota archaeon]